MGVLILCLLDVFMMCCVLVSGLCLCCFVLMHVGFNVFVRVVCDIPCDGGWYVCLCVFCEVFACFMFKVCSCVLCVRYNVTLSFVFV